MAKRTKKNSGDMAELTPYAKKWGVTNRRLFVDTGKSLFTPVSPEKASDSEERTFEKVNIEYVQRNSLQGFTTRDLLDAGGISKPGVRPNNLSNPLHPIFERHNWYHPRIPEEDAEKFEWLQKLRGDYDPKKSTVEEGILNEILDKMPPGPGVGSWDAGNDDVWKTLLPTLRLASLMLSHTTTVPCKQPNNLSTLYFSTIK